MSECTVPSIATILQCTDILSSPDASATVVKINENLAVKYGTSVSLLEAHNLSYVAKHCNVPVPRIYGTLTEEATGKNFIIMEFVDGQTLAKAWPSLTSSERNDAVDQIRQAISDLRSMPPADYIGSIARQACADGVFWTPADQRSPSVSGPFDTEDDMNQGILRRLETNEAKSHVALLRTLISTTLHGHQVVFTHGDLQPKNIIVQRTDTTAAGTSSLKIKIIDWEISGWYPEYWEFCNATISGRFNPDWLEAVQSIMSTYPHEYLMMQAIRHLLFY